MFLFFFYLISLFVHWTASHREALVLGVRWMRCNLYVAITPKSIVTGSGSNFFSFQLRVKLVWKSILFDRNTWNHLTVYKEIDIIKLDCFFETIQLLANFFFCKIEVLKLSKFLRRSLMIFIIKGFRTIVIIFIVIYGNRRRFPKLLSRQSSRGCKFNPDCRRVTIQEYLTLVPGYG